MSAIDVLSRVVKNIRQEYPLMARSVWAVGKLTDLSEAGVGAYLQTVLREEEAFTWKKSLHR